MNEFDHNGNPNRKQQAEILKLISMASAYCSIALGTVTYTYSNWPSVAAGFGVGASVIALAVAAWAVVIAFLAIKGKAKFLTVRISAILLAGVFGLGMASLIGVLLGLFFA